MKKKIETLFDDWCQAIETGQSENVLNLYDENAILLPTLSNTICQTQAQRKDYFIAFLDKKPKCTCDESYIRVFGNTAINSGSYTFTLKDGSSIQARYTFVYKEKNGQWNIIEHHSSQMPC